jgi:hypothetical protein
MSAERSAAKRPVVVIRNGMKLCAHCRDAGCDRNIGASDVEVEHIEDTPCWCCEADIEVNDDFGI